MAFIAHGATAPRKPEGLVERELTRPSLAASLGFLAYAGALHLLPLIALWTIAPFPLSALLLASRIVLTVLSGYGLFVLATTGHEGYHFNLARNPLASCAIGCVSSAMMPLFCATGFFLCHWRHHRHNNQPADPDYAHFVRYGNFLLRVAPARLAITARYFTATLRTALRGLDSGAAGLPLGDVQARWLARFNLACQAAWLTLYAWLALALPHFAQAWIPVVGAATVISSLNAYQEHAFEQGTPQPFARSRTSRVLTWLHAGSNFHVEHHLYPSVPCWRLPRVHRLLMRHGWYDDKQHLLDDGTLRSVRFGFSNYRYGGQTAKGKP